VRLGSWRETWTLCLRLSFVRLSVIGRVGISLFNPIGQVLAWMSAMHLIVRSWNRSSWPTMSTSGHSSRMYVYLPSFKGDTIVLILLACREGVHIAAVSSGPCTHLHTLSKSVVQLHLSAPERPHVYRSPSKATKSTSLSGQPALMSVHEAIISPPRFALISHVRNFDTSALNVSVICGCQSPFRTLGRESDHDEQGWEYGSRAYSPAV
jgi:hypothetical protein